MAFDPTDHPDLPVTDALPALRDALHDGRAAVLTAPPGAGKTTLVPLAVLDEPWLGDRKIIVLEPRRLAARAAAGYMSRLLGEDDAGGTVGYRVRMDTRVSRRTRIEVVTEGVLTRMLQSDPSLRDVALVVFDEFHERSLHADLGLALTRQAMELLRSDLKVLVMSATLDTGPVAEVLGGAPVIVSEGRSYDVETRYRASPVDGWIEPPVVATVRRALAEDDSDVLVFLPGAGEIRRTASRLEEAGVPDDVVVYPLFGNLSRRDQDRAIAPSPPGERKVVLATSIAETSLTIEGVRVVVDSGLMRVPRFDPGSGMTRLETVRVTRDAADQRRGRAGRTAPGVCHRLWTEGEDRGLVPRRRPEILEADLAPLALELAVWGAGPHELRWLDPPPDAALAQARELLRELEAIDDDGATDHGRRMAALGVHPRLAHMLIRGAGLGMTRTACDLAALVGDRDILRAEGRLPDADLRLRLDALRAARDRRRADVATVAGQSVHRGGLRRALRESRHLARKLGPAGIPPGKEAAAPNEDEDEDERTGRRATRSAREGGPGRDRERPNESEPDPGLLLAFAYPDRIAQRRGGRGRFLLRNGRGAAFLEPQPLAGEDWLVVADLDDRGAEARIFRAAPVSQEAIEDHFADQADTVDEVTWDADAEIVRARRRRVLGALTLAEAPLAEPDPDAVAGALVDGIREAGLHLLPWSKHTRQLRERLAFLHHHDPETWPDTSEETLLDTLDDWLRPFVPGMKRLSDLQRLDLAEALLARVPWDARRKLDELAPERIRVPSGSRIALDYADPEAPALAVRLQEVFGWTETPRIAGGRVPLTMKLLSPAMRPVQVTRDLASFWRDAYQDVRKDLRGRYPKHYWPEDPLSASAVRGGLRRNRD